jgi:hypothetical protein
VAPEGAIETQNDRVPAERIIANCGKQGFSTTPRGAISKQRGNSDGKESSEGQQEVEAGKEGAAAGLESEASLTVTRVKRCPSGHREGKAAIQLWQPSLEGSRRTRFDWQVAALTRFNQRPGGNFKK